MSDIISDRNFLRRLWDVESMALFAASGCCGRFFISSAFLDSTDCSGLVFELPQAFFQVKKAVAGHSLYAVSRGVFFADVGYW